ncbi:MAG TPA: hypothetical protein VGI58_14725 [Streptosporangiaceae bacterium]|jgi:hypothetical protein
MNADQVAALRALLAPTGWLDRTADFAHALRRSARTPRGLLIVGTRTDEPWHMTAHLQQESELADLPELAPTLVRWAPEPGGPEHLSVGLDRLTDAGREETLLVVSQQVAPDELLERVNDVRRAGATIFALDQDDPELDSLAHESLPVVPASSPVSFDGAQHLVSAAVGDPDQTGGRRRATSRTGWSDSRGHRAPAIGQRDESLRGRLARLLDAVSGTSTE